MRPINAFLALLAIVVMAGCTDSHSDNTVTPRRKAYPRATTYDTTYCLRSLPIGFAVNSNTEVIEIPDSTMSGRRSQWFDIVYPRYAATLHCTFLQVDSAQRIAALANRMERIDLNLGSLYATTQTVVSSDSTFHTSIVAASASCLTPLQFIVDGGGWVVNGALQFDSGSPDIDSIRPYIDAVCRDLIYAARNLSLRP